jgi:uncharacterized protein (TIGR02117 family)
MKTKTIKTLKYIGKALLGFVGFLILYLISAYFLSKITIDKGLNTPEEVTIYIKTNGVHTDIVMPVRNELMDWSKQVKFENTISQDTTYQYLAMGWGDKGFYLETHEWADLKTSVALKAATGMGNTTIHATFYSKMIESKSCKKLIISKEQYSKLITYISNSFQKDLNNNFIHIKTTAIYGKTDAFYEAEGSYSLLKTCNTWANSALKSCGQRCCLWTPFDSGIFSKYEEE